jgi:hypothetical protein
LVYKVTGNEIQILLAGFITNYHVLLQQPHPIVLWHFSHFVHSSHYCSLHCFNSQTYIGAMKARLFFIDALISSHFLQALISIPLRSVQPLRYLLSKHEVRAGVK